MTSQYYIPPVGAPNWSYRTWVYDNKAAYQAPAALQYRTQVAKLDVDKALDKEPVGKDVKELKEAVKDLQKLAEDEEKAKKAEKKTKPTAAEIEAAKKLLKEAEEAEAEKAETEKEVSPEEAPVEEGSVETPAPPTE